MTGPRDARSRADQWRGYVDEFHALRAGVTEEVLGRSRSDGLDAYGWLLAALPDGGSILDVACGNGPLSARSPERRWFGVDRSRAELALGRARGRSHLIRSDAAHLPFRSAAFDVVTCAMALQVITPIDGALAEMARVARGGGVVAILVSTNRPLAPGGCDRVRYGWLSVVLRHRIGYPNDAVLADAKQLFGGVGLELIGDERRRFAYEINDRAAASLLFRSLYLPGVARARQSAGVRTVERWVGATVSIPMRRLLARRR